MPQIIAADSLAARVGDDLGASDWVLVDQGIAPVRAGSEIRAHHRFPGATVRGSGWLLRNAITVEIRGEDRPALIAESLILQLTA